jgi:hypothetical protein
MKAIYYRGGLQNLELNENLKAPLAILVPASALHTSLVSDRAVFSDLVLTSPGSDTSISQPFPQVAIALTGLRGICNVAARNRPTLHGVTALSSLGPVHAARLLFALQRHLSQLLPFSSMSMQFEFLSTPKRYQRCLVRSNSNKPAWEIPELPRNTNDIRFFFLGLRQRSCWMTLHVKAARQQDNPATSESVRIYHPVYLHHQAYAHRRASHHL